MPWTPGETGVDSITRTAPTVHPGWLSEEARDESRIAEQAFGQTARFAAFAQLMRTAGALDRAATEILADLGVTAGAFFALLELEAVGEAGIAPSELARRLAVARRTATLYVDILVKNGWVSREAHPDDKRMILARLTDEGRSLLDGEGRAHKARLAQLLDSLNVIQAARLQQLLDVVPLETDTLRCDFIQEEANALT
jgi:DNA-binding MarR family transcriptional regulator